MTAAPHRLATAAQKRPGAPYTVACVCGATFTRDRLADAAIALERHQAQPAEDVDTWEDWLASA